MSEASLSDHEAFHEDGPPGSVNGGSHSGKKGMSSSAESVLSGGSDHNGGSSTNSDERIVSKEENMAVRRSKTVVLVIIAVTALAFGAATYLFTNNEETDDYETQFRDFAYEVTTVAHAEAVNVFGLVESLALAVSSFAIHQETELPNILVPHFEEKGKHNNALSKALQVSIVPIVSMDKIASWESFSVANQGWVQEGVNQTPHLHEDFLGADLKVPPINTNVHHFVDAEDPKSGSVPVESPSVDFGPGGHGVVWQQSPAPHDPSIINFDILSHPVFARVYHGMWETKLPVMSEVTDLSFLYEGAVKDDITHPHSFLMHPIFPTMDEDEYENVEPWGFIVAAIPWDAYFTNLLPESINGITVVLHNTCGEHYTYRLNGPEAVFVGAGDLHDRHYNSLGVQTVFAEFLTYDFSETLEHCEYDIRLYPTSDFEEEYRTSKPWIYAVVVVLVFMFTAGVFLGYDFLVQRRQRRTVLKAKQTNKIVAALFPSNVRDRLLKDAAEQAEQQLEEKNNKAKFKFGGAQKDQLKMFMDEEEEQHKHQPYNTKPIADLFPSATVMFADIVGFTAWSSVREPSQVFTLLETVYHAFDELAKRRRVFKVETVGDCYVAVAGLPDPRPDHVLVMARFAKECLHKMGHLTKDLEVILGPDTGDLSLRIGLHSGPVTAGVLRGDKSRFQLFGDTVNTAARMEGTGERGRIHLSEETGKELVKFNKGHWIKQRSDLVVAKGKGHMSTYWLDPKLRSAASVSGKDTSQNSSPSADKDASFIKTGPSKPVPSNEDAKMQRLIGWNTDVLGRLIKQIIARRDAQMKLGRIQQVGTKQSPVLAGQPAGSMVLDEVKEIIHLPAFDAVVVENQAEPSAITLDEEILGQLKALVGAIAQLYNGNPFHNFEHASHVTMSVVKLLSRITTADALAERKKDENGEEDINAHSLHDFTYGITSDPLTQFACVFAALIHDVDHTGVPNAQLVKEGAHIAKVYKEKSVAEQNSVDIAWNLFMNDNFLDLRMSICRTSEELNRFRELVVNGVMATDIVDKELKALRNGRWERAFSEQANPESEYDALNRKATIVIEHLIQASDVAHTMQHWHIFRKWNENLFREMYKAYVEGRAEKNPAEFWYKGEIGFFDFYVIPLAKKLDSCGVFGVSSHEYLGYAQANRDEWERRGEDIVKEYIENWKEIKQAPQEEQAVEDSTPVESFEQEPIDGDLDNV
mmetsp:Transcript_6696/g.18744  ORF Transcript_6696/g.18744 Transcript_6696/m.18744 type:complete len:1206 (-) Transcript_6696:178-3795(-)